ncbi:uncharacterized protein LOC133186049 [Saccostrea echinata]|uniref:uncharacterized protein LOC133186049 n=1 Tax=Saccostrea echinata TaxID=191078 RepID=UPI002A825910|nr:uncharacterized protein LOC133186049 [Saccostrea echinata]
MVNNITYNVNGLNRESITQGVSVKTVQRRRKTLLILRILSIATLMVSVCNLPVGIVILLYRGDMEFPLTSGAPIWSGLLVLICCIHGLKVSKMDVNYETVPSPLASFHLKSYHNINRVSVLTSLACIAFSAVYVLYCGRDSFKPDSCPTSEKEEMISNLLAILISFIMIICSIMGVILFRLNGKVLGLKKLLEKGSKENGKPRQDQAEVTTGTVRPESVELQLHRISDLHRFGPPPCNSNFSYSTEYDYRTTDIENTSHFQRIGSRLDYNFVDLSDLPHHMMNIEEKYAYNDR